MTTHDEKFLETDTGVYFKSGYLSQWYETSFEFDNIEYNCCEQFMMAQKAILFKDFETKDKIMQTKQPKEQKSLGRLVKNFDEDKWNKHADDIVYNGNLAKFSQNSELKQKLLETKNKIIVECSPYDSIWGNGLNITDTLNTPIENWKGTNRLGKAIMEVRRTLQSC